MSSRCPIATASGVASPDHQTGASQPPPCPMPPGVPPRGRRGFAGPQSQTALGRLAAAVLRVSGATVATAIAVTDRRCSWPTTGRRWRWPAVSPSCSSSPCRCGGRVAAASRPPTGDPPVPAAMVETRACWMSWCRRSCSGAHRSRLRHDRVGRPAGPPGVPRGAPTTPGRGPPLRGRPPRLGTMHASPSGPPSSTTSDRSAGIGWVRSDRGRATEGVGQCDFAPTSSRQSRCGVWRFLPTSWRRSEGASGRP
jgi:hypothetical protein